MMMKHNLPKAVFGVAPKIASAAEGMQGMQHADTRRSLANEEMQMICFSSYCRGREGLHVFVDNICCKNLL